MWGFSWNCPRLAWQPCDSLLPSFILPVPRNEVPISNQITRSSISLPWQRVLHLIDYLYWVFFINLLTWIYLFQHQGPGVPKFGSWEDEGDHPYTQYFENARKGKSPGRSATQNEHRTGDPEALFKEDTTPSAKASPLRTGSEDPVAPKPKDAAFARGKPYAEPATHKHGANTSYERKTGMERSPLHPHHQARLVNRGGVSSPSWERRGSSEGNRGAAPTTPGRSSKMRPGGRGDETVMFAAAACSGFNPSILSLWIAAAQQSRNALDR